ncbi:hypothetical protein BU23DRAFT_26396 [Bimuria novae-zelandiae CBS 107.79]|uniref:Uncharacterized protein n=1 Tax=Bimuria novae-zelandiae CBS 107.79 TaxID=1447943 RepID=A0A6A5UWE5_9PLEO|nr:hypothetical protein BU23DRAFT_26396 [Bimuria novae-zelandiae CBS 107.79]
MHQRRPSRIHHHVSLSFTTPETIAPQLYEWVSTGFPFPVSVHHYSISTRHPPLSLSSSSSETIFRITPPSLRSAGSSFDAFDSLIAEFDSDEESGVGSEANSTPWGDLESYVSTSGSSIEDLRMRLHRISIASSGGSLEDDADSDEGMLDAVSFRDPWTTWFPPTPPQGSTNASRTVSTLSPVFLDLGMAAAVPVHRSRARAAELNRIDEGNVEVHRRSLLEGLTGRREGAPGEEAGDAQGIDGEQDSGRGVRMCWVCRALLQRYARRHNLLP